MIKTNQMLYEETRGYACPKDRISGLVKKGELFPIVKGLYETERDTPGYLLAGSIYGPSYLSFDFALAWHGLIPEAVYTFTSATFNKNKHKHYQTPFGNFSYRNVPRRAYPAGIQIMREGAYTFLIADPEKALCDKLYTLPPLRSAAELENLLFEDLRLDPEVFEQLSRDRLQAYAPLYRRAIHQTFLRWLERQA